MEQAMCAEDSNTASLASFETYVTGLKSGIRRCYDRSVNKDLSQQNWQGVFKRNVTGVLKQSYKEALLQLQQLAFDRTGLAAEGARTTLTARVLVLFDGFVEELIQYALQKHRTSCALSNFPLEHNPDPAYLAEVLQETGKDWTTFTLQVDNLLAG